MQDELHGSTSSTKESDTNLAINFIPTLNCINKVDANKLDEELQGKVKQYNVEDLINDCFSCVTAICNTAFRISKGRKLKTRRTVPWWNDDLKILQKKVNPLRQRVVSWAVPVWNVSWMLFQEGRC